jgi:hypothetical protein
LTRALSGKLLRQPRRNPRRPRARIAALENREITPEERNYWAFKLPVQAPLPVVSPDLENPIDRFLESARAKKGLTAAPRADRPTLIRRAYLDLTGFPNACGGRGICRRPIRECWEKVIDQLLASPHYGERWGRHWLDVARYADSNGFEQDYDSPTRGAIATTSSRRSIRTSRTTSSLREQIAGDELDWRPGNIDRQPASCVGPGRRCALSAKKTIRSRVGITLTI